jgi:hypothetical protein
MELVSYVAMRYIGCTAFDPVRCVHSDAARHELQPDDTGALGWNEGDKNWRWKVKYCLEL